MLERISFDGSESDDLIRAGFLPDVPAFYTDSCRCRLGEIRNSLFEGDVDEKAPVFMNRDGMFFLSITMVRRISPVDGTPSDRQRLSDWYVEGENAAPREKVGSEVRLYLTSLDSDGFFHALYIQNIRE